MRFSYVTTLLMMYINCFLGVYSIKCYQCRSDLHTGCANRLTTKFLVNCEVSFQKLDEEEQQSLELASNRSVRTNSFCRKIYQKLLFTPQTSEVVIRECAYIHENKVQCRNTQLPDSQIVTCECSTDGCNRDNKGLSRHKNDFLYIMLILYSIFT